MKEKLTWSRLETPEELIKLREFGATFDHYLTDEDLTEPILIAKVGDEYIGYAQLVDRVVFPAWSPHVNPRHVVNAIKELHAFFKVNAAITGRKVVGFVARNSHNSPFTHEAMLKLGFEETALELYAG